MDVAGSPSGRRLLCAAVAVVLLGGCSADDTPVVEVTTVSVGDVTETISAPAVVQAANRQDVAASAPGVVAEIRRRDGRRVAAGELVVRLVNDDVELALEQAQAAQAALDASRSGVRIDPPGDAAVAASRQSVADLDADVGPDLAAARRRAAAIDDPAARQAAQQTVAMLEETYHDVRDALLATGRAAAQQQNAVAASFADALNQALAQATAGQAAQAAGAADAAEAQAEDLDLFAPIDGVVELGRAATSTTPVVPDELGNGAAEALAGGLGAASAAQGGRLQVGSEVAPGQTVFTVFNTRQLYVQADVDEIDAPALQAGQRAEVLLDAFPDRAFDGEVTSVAIEAQTGTTGGVSYPVRIRLLDVPDEQRRRPRLGMTASAEIVTDTVTSDQVVPARSIVRRDGGQAVFIVRDGRAELVRVDVDALGEERAAVTSSQLSTDDPVIVSGYEDLLDGDAVRVTDASASER
ncbi:MAG TPA: efflux RND transporter periplasmic adaptor subunit [Euzebyales bacterium]